MIKLILRQLNRQNARSQIVEHAKTLCLPDWDTRVYLAMLPDNPSESDVNRIINLMNQQAQRERGK